MGTFTAGAPLRAGELKRQFTFRSTFSLAFAFISPIIGLYTIFALALGTGGTGVLARVPRRPGRTVAGRARAGRVELALARSRRPVQVDRALGRRDRLGWAAGWAYTWTLIVLVTAQCYAAAPFLLGIFDVTEAEQADAVAHQRA